jgi:hypothetical protein
MSRKNRTTWVLGCAIAGVTMLGLARGWVADGTTSAVAAEQPAADPYVGHFTSDSDISVDIANQGGHYTGVIHFNKTDMPLTGDVTDGHLQGTFTTGGSSFAFTAQSQGTALTLSTGGKTYQLTNAQAAAAAPAAAAANGGTQMTVDQIGQALDKYGKNSATDNGSTTFSLNVKRGKWDINVIVSLSPNGRMIWMTNHLSSVPDPGKVSSDALAKLLEKNTEIGPMFFSMVGPRHSLMLSNPVPNYDLTAESLQARVEALVATVIDTESLWNNDALAPQTAPEPANPLSR